MSPRFHLLSISLSFSKWWIDLYLQSAPLVFRPLEALSHYVTSSPRSSSRLFRFLEKVNLSGDCSSKSNGGYCIAKNSILRLASLMRLSLFLLSLPPPFPPSSFLSLVSLDDDNEPSGSAPASGMCCPPGGSFCRTDVNVEWMGACCFERKANMILVSVMNWLINL